MLTDKRCKATDVYTRLMLHVNAPRLGMAGYTPVCVQKETLAAETPLEDDADLSKFFGYDDEDLDN